jgi:hypothetical protein
VDTVWVEPGRETTEDMVSVRSEGATIVDAMDIVRCCGMLPWLVFLVFAPGVMFNVWMEPDGDFCSPGDISVPPDSRLRFGMTLPLIVCVYSGSLVYEVMDMVRSSGRSGTTRPCAVVLAMWFM